MSVRRVASDPGWLVPLAFLAAVAFQIAFALGVGRSAVARGGEPPGTRVVVVLVWVGLAMGLAGSVVRAAGRRRLDALTFAAPTFAAFLLAGEFAFDPYYAPSLRRYAADVPTGWFVAAAVVGVAPVLARRFGPQPSAVTTLVALPVLLFFLVGNGH